MSLNSRRRGVQLTSDGAKVVQGLIEHEHLTYEKLAETTELSIDTVKRFLNGQKVDRNSVVAIAKALNLRPSDMIDPNEWNPQPFQSNSVPSLSQISAPEPSSNGSFYISRCNIETQCYGALTKPGALLRIKAPQKMGKTSLITQVLAQIREKEEYQTAILSFGLADQANFASLKSLTRWFCAVASRELELENRIDDFWEDILACNYNTTIYFQNYLLAQITSPLVLVLDNTDLVFEQFEVATDFCRLLRNWHDQARRSDRNSQNWQKLRLMVVHATEVYSSLDINFSPLAGVGTAIDLPEFSLEQAQDLAKQHGLLWTLTEIEKLMNLVGGHPHLLQLAFEHIRYQNITLDQLLQEAHTEVGIYRNHLRQLLNNLEQSSELASAFRAVITTEGAVQLKSAHAFKLYSMGLVDLKGNRAKPRCFLYRKYFLNCLSN